ncbi:MAG: cation-translocating P-type ATPase [Asgard group archaeon]|nr:cation-translocating P-type ATPase [Asgard group archaeon]
MNLSKLQYKIIGLDCAGCAKGLEDKLLKQKGIEDVRINLAYKKIYISYSSEITEELVIKQIEKSGYSVYNEIETDERKTQNLAKMIFKRREFYTLLVSIILFTIGLFLEFLTDFDIATLVLLICSTIIGGVFIFRKALYSIRNLNLDINFLMTLAAIAALIINEAIEAASIVILFSVAELIESLTIERSKRTIEQLISFAPIEATLLTKDGELIVPAKEVKVGQHIIVKAGDRIPLDGIISKGEASINQAAITGESMPALKTIDAEVYGGTLCENGTLEIEITKTYDNIFIRKIVELVESADQRAPIESFVNVFAKYYTPIMLLIASITLLVPPLITGDPFIEWVYIALVIIVISCPCAVVLSTPITIVTAINKSAKNGVLIKGGTFIEALSKTKVFAFDKTGTLTMGHPQVVEIITSDDFSDDQLIRISGSLEMESKHPIAKAIIEEMHKREIDALKVQNLSTLVGIGLEGIINGKKWLLGSYRIINNYDLKIDEELSTKIALLQSEQKSIVVLSDTRKVVGILAIRDELKPHAKGFISELKNLKIDKTIMLTGDTTKTAAVMADELNLDEYRAELLPDQKMDILDDLANEYGHIAMLGDGINDAPALAHAPVGIALGASGSDIAIESADIALMTDSFESLHYLISISRKAMRIIIQNIIIAILIKIVLFVLAYFGLIELWMAVLIGDMGVSLFVIFNAVLRVRGKKMTHEYCSDDVCEISTENGQNNSAIKK